MQSPATRVPGREPQIDARITALVAAMRANGAYAAVCAAVDKADETGEDPGVLLQQSGGAEMMQQAAETSGFMAFAQRRSQRLARAARAALGTRVPNGAVRATPRVRERRERRHVARTTSSSDGPDGEPGSPPRRISFDPPRDAPARWRWVSEAIA